MSTLKVDALETLDGLHTVNVADLVPGGGGGTGDVTLVGEQSITNKIVYAFKQQVNAGNTGTALTISFAGGQKQRATLTGNTTLTLSFPGVGNYQLILAQDSAGARTVAFAGTVSYLNSATQPPINTAPNGRTLFSIFWDGTEQIIGVAKIGAA